ncbi:putative amidoligase enzyme-domain-containing protein [Xylariaceae sp. FL0662B]|nr:putative amidoligase enzyme-domain-containing protein [Xylariaceae sp. FL0662B]
MSSAVELDLRFGFELETIAKVPGHGWAHTANVVKNALAKQGIESRVGRYDDFTEDPLKEDRDYGKWTIKKESLYYPADTVGIELISPFFTFSNKSWTCEVKQVWAALAEFNSGPNPTCSTHIHVSIAGHDGLFPVEKARLISMAAVCFEKCIDSIMPDHRLKSGFCASNRGNVKLNQMTLEQIHEAIEERTDIDKLARLICTNAPANGGRGVSSHYRVNLSGIDFKTIEFRQPPGSRDATETQDWINFVCWTVRAALSKDLSPYFRSQRELQVDDFKKFIESEMEGPEEDHDKFWNRIKVYKEKPMVGNWDKKPAK